jgi:tetratricopeptide (TPR) repeat protein
VARHPLIWALLAAGCPLVLHAQADAKTSGSARQTAQKQPQKPKVVVEEPPEEEPGLKPKSYSFNPIQANKELSVGKFYYKKGDYRAAANRFTEATHWNPGFAEAYLRLGEADEKLGDRDGAHKAFEKFLDIAPDSKEAASVKKKLARKR